MFDAAVALAANKATSRVEVFEDQDLLDVSNKSRTSILPWRGQFSPQFIEYLIQSNVSAGSFIVDPFCGSGTVLYESASCGSSAYGADINPAAVCLSQFSEVCALSKQERLVTIEHIRTLLRRLALSIDPTPGSVLSVDQAAKHLLNSKLVGPDLSAAHAALLLAFGNQPMTVASKLLRTARTIESAIWNAPTASGSLRSDLADARDLDLESSSVDYILTSPPYINVFNYHQNYRSIIEALGHTPLPIARAEIGANRKFRQNRYMTVVQYCIDMSLFFEEAHRLLRENAKMTIVLGRESNVRGVAFKNGEIIAAIAADGHGWSIESWYERKFLNRFGETIYEDVISLYPPSPRPKATETVGRSVGAEALRSALAYAPRERASEIDEAIEKAKDIECSPYVLKENKVTHG
jgi:16S rRNA G966 N2-methylase RsmD